MIWSQAASSDKWRHRNDTRYLLLCFLLSKEKKERKREGSREGGKEGGKEGRRGEERKKEKVLKYRQIRGTWKVISGIDAL